jgi:precorrin-2 dehydrogenase/sirohydrochlorin ferrochelatase
MIPVLLDLRGKRVLVVGGGAVGRRKARAARDGGAVVRLVAPEPLHADFAADTSVEWVQASYHADHMQGMALVFAAATPAVNDRVALDAIRRGVWVNSATDPTAGDFTLPAVVRRGELVLAASTGGAAPALARRIREKLEAEFDEAFATWIRLLETIRPLARERIADPERRRALLDAFADWPWLERLRTGGEAAVWEMMVKGVREAD